MFSASLPTCRHLRRVSRHYLNTSTEQVERTRAVGPSIGSSVCPRAGNKTGLSRIFPKIFTTYWRRWEKPCTTLSRARISLPTSTACLNSYCSALIYCRGEGIDYVPHPTRTPPLRATPLAPGGRPRRPSPPQGSARALQRPGGFGFPALSVSRPRRYWPPRPRRFRRRGFPHPPAPDHPHD